MLEIRADIAGNVWQVAVSEGDCISQGDVVVVLESMKMEIPVLAAAGGTVAGVLAHEGMAVQEGDILVIMRV